MQTIGVSAGGERRGDLAVDGRVGLAEQRPPLGVADDHVLGAGLADHRRADLAGERALALPVQVLRGDRDVAVARRFGRGVERGERSAPGRSRRRRCPSPGARNSLTYFTASATVLYIFQLPQMKGIAWSRNSECEFRCRHYRFEAVRASALAFQTSGSTATPAASGRRGTRATRRRRSRCA